MDIKPHPRLGFNPSAPYVETSEASEKTAKETYKGISLKGNIEKDFLYATLLSTDIVPFGYLDFRIVVLPLIENLSPSPLSPPIEGGESALAPGGRGLGRGGILNHGYQIIKEAEASKKGLIHLSKWLNKAQKIWEEKRREKAERIDVVDWIDYRHKLTEQKKAKYKVLYPTSATYLCGCVVEKKVIKNEKSL